MDNLAPAVKVPSWLSWMRKNKGEIEFTGHASTQFIEDCFKHTTYGPLHGMTPPCCAATLCRCLEECGYKSPKSAAASSYMTYGIPVKYITPGTILVFEFNPGHYHVTLADHIVNDQLVSCTGGNQSHELTTSIYDRKFIVAQRFPV